MAMTITPDHDTEFDTEFETSGRRRKITKFALAGVAVLGVGAALTSAAWTDNVWFGGSTEAGNADLQGSVDGGDSWAEGASRAARIDIVDGFEDVGPGVSVTREVLVQNIGTTDLALVLDAEGSGPMFATATNSAGASGSATVVATLDDPTDALLEVGEIAEITVTVTGWEYWPQNFQGRSGNVVVNVQGTVGLD